VQVPDHAETEEMKAKVIKNVKDLQNGVKT